MSSEFVRKSKTAVITIAFQMFSLWVYLRGLWIYFLGYNIKCVEFYQPGYWRVWRSVCNKTGWVSCGRPCCHTWVLAWHRWWHTWTAGRPQCQSLVPHKWRIWWQQTQVSASTGLPVPCHGNRPPADNTTDKAF